MTTVQDAPAVRTYGGWRRRRGIGIGGLDGRQSVLVLGAVFAVLIAGVFSLRIALVLLAPGVVAVGLAVAHWDGVWFVDALTARYRWARARRRQHTSLRAGGLISHARAWQLPGLLAPTRCLQVDDGEGGSYGIVWDRRTGLLTATLRVAATGVLLADREDADDWVASWGGWLAALGAEPTVRWDRPASVDISAVTNQGDTAVAAAMFCSWAWGFSLLDAAAAAGERRQRLVVLDEMWRALRAAPGLVEHADQLTRLNRHTGAATVMVTHSLADLEALSTEEDRAKARGFIERCGITILGALPAQELDRVARVTPMTSAERELVSSWAAPPSWTPTAAHPGRGKYLVKTGARLGIPVDLRLVEAERALYDTDQAVRA